MSIKNDDIYRSNNDNKRIKHKIGKTGESLLSGMRSAGAVTKRQFGYYCDEWLRLKRDRVRQSTYIKYMGMLEKHIKPRLGGCAVRSLNSLVVEQFSHDLLCEEKLSPKTVKDILILLSTVLKYTAKQIPRGMARIEIVYPKIGKSEMRVLTKEEQVRFVSFLLEDTDEYKLGVLLALLTGMRIGEVCALKCGNVSLSEGLIRVNSTMQRLKALDGEADGKTRIVISDPKSDSSSRIIPLTEYALKICSAHVCDNPKAFLLTGEENRYIEPRTLQYRMKRYTEACGIEGVHFHTLRHTFATRCVEVDFEIKSLSEILGHSNPRITLERYVHSSLELKRNNMKKLSSIGF